MYRSSRPLISPFMTSVEVTSPPEGCTISAVRPATLRTGASARGGGCGISAPGDAGLESSGLRHMEFSPKPKLRDYRAGAVRKQPGEDGRVRTIIRRTKPVNPLCFQSDTAPRTTWQMLN